VNLAKTAPQAAIHARKNLVHHGSTEDTEFLRLLRTRCRFARYPADRIAVMQRGELVEVGDTEQITTTPRHPYTRALLAATPELRVAQ